MSSVPSVANAVAELASTFSGQLLGSADAGYEEARRVHNDTGFPARREGYNFIVVGEWMEPRDTDRCIAWARETFAKMQRFAVGRYVNYLTDDEAIDAVATVCGPNYGLIDKRPALIAGGLMIDLAPMKGIHVDPKNRTARAQGGTTWAEQWLTLKRHCGRLRLA